MTIVQIYKRFLKENGLYPYFISYNRKIFLKSKEIFESDDDFIKKFCPYGPITDLLFNTIGILPGYRGSSYSKDRRRFYRLNKKWRDLVKTIRVQHNLSVGDKVNNVIGWWRGVKGEIGKFYDNGVVSLTDRYGAIKTRIYSLENDEKKFFRNYYITNENGTYGKVDGEFNETQLQ